MKIKTKLTLAAIIAVGLLASGCQQMGSQQTASQQTAGQQAVAGEVVETTTTTTETEVKQVVDCSQCHQGGGSKGGSGSGMVKPDKRGGGSTGNKRGGGSQASGQWCHTHAPIPGCTDTVRHCHPYTNPNHTHHYNCKGGKGPRRVVDKVVPPRYDNKPRTHEQPPKIVMPKVKAKGTYRGRIAIETGVMQQYQQ